MVRASTGVLTVLVCALAAANAQTCASGTETGCVTTILASQTLLSRLDASALPSSTFRKTVDEVSLTFSVTDPKGHAVPGITPEKFSILEDHALVTGLTSFSHQESPLRVGLLVDWSESVSDQFQYERQAATAFLRRVMRPGFDEGFVLGFGARWKMMQPLTSDSDRMVRAVRAVNDGWLSAVYDAVVAACTGEMTRPGADSQIRRAIILLSDGQDNYSMSSLSDAIAAAQKADVAIYVVTTRGQHWDRRGEKILRELTAGTGGHAYVLSRPGDYLAAFGSIEEELRASYTVSFKPLSQHDGRFHSVQVAVRDRNLKVHARPGYFAPKP
jgi:Ca-activated chloride channel family protein